MLNNNDNEQTNQRNNMKTNKHTHEPRLKSSFSPDGENVEKTGIFELRVKEGGDK